MRYYEYKKIFYPSVHLDLKKIRDENFKYLKFGFIIDHQTDYHYVLRKLNNIYLLHEVGYFTGETIISYGFSILDIKDYLEKIHPINVILK